MEFRDRLLSSEIRHVTDLVNMLSYELVIIQDFMQQQFGFKFKKFREQHLLSCEVRHENKSKHLKSTHAAGRGANNNRDTFIGHESANNTAPNVNSTTIDTSEVNSRGDPLIDTSQIEGDRFDETTYNDEDEEVMCFEDGLDENPVNADDSDFDYNDDKHAGGVEGYDDTDFDSDDGNKTGLNKRESGGRKKIWSRFDCKRLPGGKKIAKCKKCKQQVSAVPKRLERHYDHCVLGKPLAPLVTVKKESVPGESVGPTRKPLGVVWKYFNKVTNAEGHVVVTCKFCQKKVSNHATRMSKHLQNCSKPGDIEIESSQ